MTTEVDLKLLETMIRLKQEEDGITQGGRDPYAEAARDMRSYSADPYSRHRLENQRHEGTPIASVRVPQMVTMEQDADGKWWANKPAFGPFDTVRDLEIAVYGRSDLSAGKRDPRDEAPKPCE
jgi:hypothetical protein